MSRTLRRLPIGPWKKYGRIGYYNRHTRMLAPSDIHVLQTPQKPQSSGQFIRRYGLYLFAPYSSGRMYYDYYSQSELRPSKRSIAGPSWIAAEDFYLEHPLILKGWTYNVRSEKHQTGPEEWEYTYKSLGPNFQWSWLWKPNPDFDQELQDAYHRWHSVHVLVCRNGHYKDKHPGRAWRRDDKQRDHQIIRSRLKHALLKELWSEDK
jgi:hypothetical protein